MTTHGWYYLHINGDLIFKRDLPGTAADIRESDLAKALWSIDTTDRESAWSLLVEALAAGANPGRVRQLAALWKCDDDDARIYAKHIGVSIKRDESALLAHTADFINIAESPVGFGDTALEALAGLAKALGYRPSKMWGSSFRDLVAGKGGAS